jgi:hypothetical protein
MSSLLDEWNLQLRDMKWPNEREGRDYLGLLECHIFWYNHILGVE